MHSSRISAPPSLLTAPPFSMALSLCAVSEAFSRLTALRSYSTCRQCGAIFQINSLLRNRFGLEKLSTIRHVTPRGLSEPRIAEKKLRIYCFRTYTTMTYNAKYYGNSDRKEEQSISRSFLLYLLAGVVLCAETNQGLLCLLLQVLC